MPHICQNCDTPLVGRWCHACGQRRIDPEQRTLRWLLGQFAEALTEVDSKFLRSLRALLFQPGRLGSEWLAGRRASWTSPIALFLMINVAYFFAPQLTDLNLPLADQFWQWYGSNARWLVEQRVAFRNISLSDYATVFQTESANLAKSLIILHVPPFALLLMLVNFRRAIPFVDHFAVSLHVWTTFLTAMLIFPMLLTGAAWLSAQVGMVGDDSVWQRILQYSLFFTVTWHIFGTLRRAYGQSRWMALALTPLLYIAGMLIHFGYRAVLFYVTFALT